MPLFYRGAGVGTYWHNNDARLTGFSPQLPGATASPPRLMMHIAKGTVTSPYVSLTRSYGVAWNYGVYSGHARPSQSNPGYVYELEIGDPAPSGVQVLDPVKEVAAALPGPLVGISYHHDGDQTFLLGVVDPLNMGGYLQAPYLQPPPGSGTSRPSNLSMELETLVRALRDAEILALGNIPASCVRNRFEVW